MSKYIDHGKGVERMFFEGLNHVHLKVADVERSTRFYAQGFGMQVEQSEFGGKVVTLATPGKGDNLTLSEGVPEGLLDFTGNADPGDSGGIDHIGFVLTGSALLDDAIDWLVSLGGSLVCTLRPKRESAFLRDPDGYVIQI
jgi:catechol 2,3-dioxygenase